MRFALLGAVLAVPPAHAAGVDFNRDVRPILADTCYHCHGPDGANRRAGLRLDTPDGALKPRKHGAAVVPGDSGASELVRRITSTDPDEVMPPPDSNRHLTPAQAGTLKAWIDQGAKFAPHWAFVPLPGAVPVPAAPAGTGPVDAFLLDRLRRANLDPGPAAPPAVWLRRVSLDLTGLPPTPAEAERFRLRVGFRGVGRAMGDAVDRLLASPRYGERMAADWLDLARYADTHGYQADRLRPVWPYRDWVINAFNRNQPYDQFLTAQLAGDLLPDATQ